MDRPAQGVLPRRERVMSATELTAGDRAVPAIQRTDAARAEVHRDVAARPREQFVQRKSFVSERGERAHAECEVARDVVDLEQGIASIEEDGAHRHARHHARSVRAAA